MDRNKIFVGAIDMHLHFAPDTIPRKVDALELARRAKNAGMRAILLKCHASPTAALATLVEKAVPGIRVFGGLVLNESVGGINPEAVKAAIALGAKAIWMPTVSARNHLKHMKTTSAPAFLRTLGAVSGEGISILGESGEVLPEVREIIALVKKADLILATGHLSSAEIRALAKEVKEAGLRKFVVTHPESAISWMSNEEQRALLPYGAWFERCYFATTKLGQSLDPAVIAETIKEVGAETTVLSSDLGQVDNPDPLEGFRDYLESLLTCGISQEAIHIMIHENPSRLLGI
jgi:hypothetical protein